MNEIPSIAIVTRHSADCAHKDEPEYRRCNCRKSLRYTYQGKVVWKKTGRRTWAGAEEFRREFESSFGREAVAEEKQRTLTVRDAVSAFLDEKRGQNISGEVVKKYSRELNRFLEFCERNQRHTMHQVSLQDLSAFRATWEQEYPSSLTRQKVQGRLRELFKYCLHSDLITKNTASGLSRIKLDRVPTQPLNQGEYDSLLAAASAAFAGNQRKQIRIRAFLACMRHSGLAIRDTVCLPRTYLCQVPKGDKVIDVVVTARTKNGNDVYVPIAPDIAAELRACPNDNPQYFFWNTGVGKPQTAVTHWQTDLRKLFQQAGVVSQGNMLSHRLRDTFAVQMLGKGVRIELVSMMLGHDSVRTTEKHYSAWVKVRQDNLISEVTATWAASQGQVPTLVTD